MNYHWKPFFLGCSYLQFFGTDTRKLNNIFVQQHKHVATHTMHIQEKKRKNFLHRRLLSFIQFI